MLPVPEHNYQRTSAVYTGGEYRQWTETPNTQITLAFESVPWTHEDVYAFYIMNTLIGSAGKLFFLYKSIILFWRTWKRHVLQSYYQHDAEIWICG